MNLERAFTLIRQLQGAMEGKTNRSGASNVTYPGASTFSNTKSVTHGLGKAPSEVQVTPYGTRWATVNLMSVDASQFTVQFQVNDTSVSPSSGTVQAFYWRVSG